MHKINENSESLNSTRGKHLTTCEVSSCAAPLFLVASSLHKNKLSMAEEEFQERKGTLSLKVKGFSMDRDVGLTKEQT